MTILMVCSCSEKKGEQDKSPTRVQTQIVSSASSDGSHTCVGIIEERQATGGESKSVFFEVSICQFVNFGRKEIKKLRD